MIRYTLCLLALVLAGCASAPQSSTPYSHCARGENDDFHRVPLGLMIEDRRIPTKNEVVFSRSENEGHVRVLSAWNPQAGYRLFIYVRSANGMLIARDRDDNCEIAFEDGDTEVVVFTLRGTPANREEAYLEGLVSRDVFTL